MTASGQILAVSAVESTELFVGTVDDPVQVVRVRLDGPPGRVAVSIVAAGVLPAEPVVADLPGKAATVEVPVRFAADPVTGAEIGAVVPVTVRVEPGAGAAVEAAAELTVAEPGWTAYLISHFHYDPVWWNTQAAYTESWDALD